MENKTIKILFTLLFGIISALPGLLKAEIWDKDFEYIYYIVFKIEATRYYLAEINYFF